LRLWLVAAEVRDAWSSSVSCDVIFNELGCNLVHVRSRGNGGGVRLQQEYVRA